MSRADRLLQGEPESYAHGYLSLTRAQAAKATGDIQGAIKRATTALELGTKYGDPDLQAWSLMEQGTALIAAGRPDEGFPLMEEATVAAINGELDPFTAGVAYCQMHA